VLLDTDRVFHGVDRVGGADAPVPPLRPGMCLSFADGRWLVLDGGVEVADYDWDQIRFSVSWKAYCFADEAERVRWRDHADDLSLEFILDRLVDDLRQRGRVSEPPEDENELGRLLIGEYIQFPAPTP
jgi:hypothetical protein